VRTLIVNACFIWIVLAGSAFSSFAQNTCSARCPDGSMSETYDCNSNYVPACLRSPAPNVPATSQTPQPSEPRLPDPQSIPHLEWNKGKKVWQPAHGYEFVNSSDDDDFRVRQIPHLEWNEGKKVWQPAPGYEFVNSSDDDDFRVTRIPVPTQPSNSDPDAPSTRKTLVGTYITAACYQSDDASEECSRSLSTAADALSDAMVEEAVRAASKKTLSIHFPSVVAKAEQIKLLFDLENKAIYLTQWKINADVKKLGVFSTRQPLFFEVQAEIARDAILLNKIHKEAVEQANRGTNWDHNWKTGTHTFRSNTYDQAVQIHFSGSFPN